MAGYGNHTAPDYTGNEHETTRLGLHESTDAYSGGHPEMKSGAVGGAGFGNKSAPDTDMSTYDNSDLRFDSKHTEPYSGGHPIHKSGSVGGAGFGRLP